MRLTSPLPPAWEKGPGRLASATLPLVRRKLKLGCAQYFPLVPAATAARDLGLDAREIRALVDLGYLVAFNIAVGDVTPELRFLDCSLRQFKACHGRETFAEHWPGIFRHIIPFQCPCLTGLEIQQALNCHRSVVSGLIRAGHLRQLRQATPGPGGSCVVTRPSFETFLQSRQL